MRAAWFESFGPAKDTIVIGEKETPTPAPGEVLVKMKFTCPNPSDVKKRAGAFPNLLDDGYVIPNSDGSGIIEAVGEGVDPSRVGERVFLYQAQFGRRFGTAAQYVAIDSQRAPTLPDNASFEEGALIGIPIMTAHRCVHSDGPVAGKTLLITGGAGRVGYYAIQWAKMAGARVIATASNEADANTCREMGADEVVNHRQENWGEDVLKANNGNKVERVIDVEFGANLPEVLKCIGINGVIATYSSTQVREPKLPFIQMMFMDLTIRMVIVYAMPEDAKAHAIADTQAAMSNGKLSHRIAHSLSFEEMAKSNELIEEGGFGGCVVVSCE